MSFLKQYEVLNLEKLLQTVKTMVFGSGKNIRDDLQHVVKTDVMLSPGTTSLGITNVGRGRIPFHGPTFWKSTGPRQGKSRSSRTIPEKHVTSKTEYTNTQQGLPVSWYT
jgi:hypothetical protein